MATDQILLSITTTGTIPDYSKLYQRLGLQATFSFSLRNALAQIKKLRPAIVVAEFVYAPTYGSQLSNFESVLAAIQSYASTSKIVALVYPDDIDHCKKVLEHTWDYLLITLPVSEDKLEDLINSLL